MSLFSKIFIPNSFCCLDLQKFLFKKITFLILQKANGKAAQILENLLTQQKYASPFIRKNISWSGNTLTSWLRSYHLYSQRIHSKWNTSLKVYFTKKTRKKEILVKWPHWITFIRKLRIPYFIHWYQWHLKIHANWSSQLRTLCEFISLETCTF